MKQFILTRPPSPDGIIRLYGEDYHYLARVRRLREGAVFKAVLPELSPETSPDLPGKFQGEITVKVLSTEDGILIGECQDFVRTRAPDLPPIALFQGLPKALKMDIIVRQAAEGTVSEIVPFQGEYSVVKIRKEDPGAGAEKIKRWERIIKEARQQSGSPVNTVIKSPRDLDALLAYWEEARKCRRNPLGIILHQESWNARGPLEQGSFHGYLSTEPDYIALAVGPEGGFSPAEVERFLAAGFKPLLMGNTILRTETAALYGAAAIRIILLENAAWIHKPRTRQIPAELNRP
jgi:16S rRNA (uracil1498-N3)-methyltransferase